MLIELLLVGILAYRYRHSMLIKLLLVGIFVLIYRHNYYFHMISKLDNQNELWLNQKVRFIPLIDNIAFILASRSYVDSLCYNSNFICTFGSYTNIENLFHMCKIDNDYSTLYSSSVIMGCINQDQIFLKFKLIKSNDVSICIVRGCLQSDKS